MSKRPPPTWSDLHEALVGAMDIGAQKGMVDTVEALAEALGISQLHGLTIREFFNVAAVERTEVAIADIADDDQQLAGLVKARWDKIRGGSDGLSEHSASCARARQTGR